MKATVLKANIVKMALLRPAVRKLLAVTASTALDPVYLLGSPLSSWPMNWVTTWDHLTPTAMCYNAEAGCYAGAVACPAGGSGSIMSYCHFGGPNGADCGLNDEDFHPTVISLIDTQIVSNFPSCIQTLGSDIIFINSFE